MSDSSFNDQDAVDYLATQLGTEEHGASSHWRDMHASFGYSEGAFTGLRGFGTYTARSRRIRNLAHRLLLQKWRRFGDSFADFVRVEGLARQLVRRQSRVYDLDVLRQALTLAYLQARVPHALVPGNTLIVIGDGYGTFSSIALAAFPGLRVVTINLVKTLLVDMVFIAQALPGVRQVLVTDEESMRRALDDASCSVVALRAQDSTLLRIVPASLAVNIASMQEMNPGVIGRYFEILRAIARPILFYCCNREEKILPDGTVVKFASYPWRADDEVLDDGLCPWHQQYYSARPPFVHSYDGPLRHRLARLATSAALPAA